MKLLSFDLSTTVLGYSVFDKSNSEMLDIGYYSFTNKELLDRAGELEKFVDSIFSKYKDIDSFAIEERLKSFRAGGTSADAMLKTSQLNFLCQYLMKYKHNVTVLEINVNVARSACFPGFHKMARTMKGTKHKVLVFELFKKIIDVSLLPTKVMKAGARKGETVFLDEAMDMADSWVIGRAALINDK